MQRSEVTGLGVGGRDNVGECPVAISGDLSANCGGGEQCVCVCVCGTCRSAVSTAH